MNEEIKIGDWVRFYTNTTRPNTTILGKVVRIEKNGQLVAQGAVMRNYVEPTNVTEVNGVKYEHVK